MGCGEEVSIPLLSRLGSVGSVVSSPRPVTHFWHTVLLLFIINNVLIKVTKTLQGHRTKSDNRKNKRTEALTVSMGANNSTVQYNHYRLKKDDIARGVVVHIFNK